MDYQKVGAFIKEKRLKKNLTQQELSEALFVDVTSVSKWERGVSFPDSGIITKLCACLGINEHELFVACEDQEYRNAKSQLKRIRDGKTVAFSIITGLYLVAILTCFICNLAINHTLDWFWLVFGGCLCGWTYFPTAMRFFKKNRLEWFIATTFGSTVLLFFICSIYTNNYWCFIASLGTLLFSFLFYFPFIFFKKDYIKIRKEFFLLIYCVVSCVLTVSLLYVIDSYASFNVINAVLISLYCYAPFIVAGIISIIPKINRLLKSSMILFEAGAFSYGLNGLLNMMLDPGKTNVYKINFLDWKTCSDGNVSLIVLASCLIASLVLLILGLIKKTKHKINR